jgi:hypothetical protein
VKGATLSVKLILEELILVVGLCYKSKQATSAYSWKDIWAAFIKGEHQKSLNALELH